MQQALRNLEKAGATSGDYNPDFTACAALVDVIEEAAFRAGELLPRTEEG
jgi:hypothetical protein